MTDPRSLLADIKNRAHYQLTRARPMGLLVNSIFSKLPILEQQSHVSDAC